MSGTYVPSEARRPRKNYPRTRKSRFQQAGEDAILDMVDGEEEEEEEPTPRQQLSLATRLLAEANPPRLGRPPEGDDEKRLVLRALVYLKAANMTNAACATELNVSERTIANYLKDEVYTEIQQEIVAHSKQAGYTSIGSMVSSAMEKLFQLLDAKSEFVQFKSAEYILKMAGYEQPPEGRVAETREEVVRFLDQVRAADAARNMVVNITVNPTSGQPEPAAAAHYYREPQPVVDALPPPTPPSPLLFEPSPAHSSSRSEQPGELPPDDELAPYYMPVLPGGRLPWPQESPEASVAPPARQ